MVRESRGRALRDVGADAVEERAALRRREAIGREKNARGRRRARGGFRAAEWEASDPFSMLGETGGQPGHARPASEGRKILNAQRRAFDVLGLEADAKRTDIKARFKMLVKRHHPDANGGDRGSEDTLREIIQAYNYLKSAGFC